MALKLPLVITGGVVQQLQSGDTIITGSAGLTLNQHVIAADFTITPGYSASIERYLEIAPGITLEIGADGDLGIQ